MLGPLTVPNGVEYLRVGELSGGYKRKRVGYLSRKKIDGVHVLCSVQCKLRRWHLKCTYYVLYGGVKRKETVTTQR